MRELVPLVVGGLMPSDTEHLDRTLRKATRRLGRARDMEVMLETLAALEPAAPTAAGEIGRLRLEWQEERDRRVRRAIKSLERMDIETTLRELQWMLAPNKPALLGLRRQRQRHRDGRKRWSPSSANAPATWRRRSAAPAAWRSRSGCTARGSHSRSFDTRWKSRRRPARIDFEQELRAAA